MSKLMNTTKNAAESHGEVGGEWQQKDGSHLTNDVGLCGEGEMQDESANYNPEDGGKGDVDGTDGNPGANLGGTLLAY